MKNTDTETRLKIRSRFTTTKIKRRTRVDYNTPENQVEGIISLASIRDKFLFTIASKLSNGEKSHMKSLLKDR